MKGLFFLALMLLIGGFAFADISSYYTFADGDTTYTPIVGTPITITALYDGISDEIQIGFPFTYGLNSYTVVKVNANGWIGLGSAHSATNGWTNLLESTAICPVLAPYWDDLAINLPTTNLSYLLEGNAPNRVFTIQFTDVCHSNGPDVLDFQAKLYENGKIEFVYGPGGGITFGGASIGINMLPGGSTNFWSVTPGSPASASNTNANNNIYLIWPGDGTKYTFNPPPPVVNDLAALSITGNLHPSVGLISPYSVTIRNIGIASHAAGSYQVKLMSGNTELASIGGPAITPSTNVVVHVPWTPIAPGNGSIYGKVVLTGDVNAANDITSNLDVLVWEEGTVVVAIGSGNQTSNLSPVSMTYKNSLFETVYPESEITAGGSISAITFYNNFASNIGNKPVNIWMGTTTLANLSSGWIPATQLQQVFTGNVLFPAGTNLITIPFTNPFAYTSGNLVVMVQRPMDTSNYLSSDVFLHQTTGTNRTRRLFSNTTVYNPESPTGGAATGQFPKTLLHFTANGATPQLSIIPDAYNFGQVLAGNSETHQFTMMNIGGAPLTVNSATISGSPFFTIQNLPALPVTLPGGQSVTFQAVYAPTADGEHEATITISDNLTRVNHPVPLNGNCLDPYLHTLPYTQDFDTGITMPALPSDWLSLSTGVGTVETADVQPHSPLYYVRLFNLSDTSGPYLIAPPLNNAIPINTVRVKFWAKSTVSTATLKIGVMSNPTVSSTFVQAQAINLTTSWVQYAVSFQQFLDNGNYITFKHGAALGYQNVYIDDVIIEVIPQNDLTAISLSGNLTPTVGISSNYVCLIENTGYLPQSNYQVKLFAQDNTELASVNGSVIQPGLRASVTIPWMPVTAGIVTVYGKVVLAGDAENTNDQTPNVELTVQSPGTFLATIGQGNQTARLPMDFLHRSSLNETIYLQSELNFYGSITGIRLYNSFVDQLGNKPTQVWLGTTTQTNLSSGWIPATSLTQVFDGTVTYPMGTNAVNIVFSNPFQYLSGNLVVMFHRPQETAVAAANNYFFCQTIGTNRARNAWDDAGNVDPASPPEGTNTTGQFAKTSISYIPEGVGSLTGTVNNASNQPLTGVNIQILNGVSAITNVEGHYAIPNLVPGTYQVTVSKNGYVSQTTSFTVLTSQAVTRDFTLVQLQTVVLSGRIVGSDAPTVGISGAVIGLSGYENYTATTNASGMFSITGVYVNHEYLYQAAFAGYQILSGTVNVLNSNVNMGDITLNENAYPPRNLTAAPNAENTSVTLNWILPDPNASDVDQGFESEQFPPIGWSRVITNNNPPNPDGVYPTWCRLGAVTVGTDLITPPDGEWQAGFWWSFSHQDEWLITPGFICPDEANLIFESNVFLGSANGDHYYVKVSTDNGNTWSILWDASTQAGGWNHYNTPITIGLSQFADQQIKLAWNASDPVTDDGMWYVWFIDHIQISNGRTELEFSEASLTSRSIAADKYSAKSSQKEGFSRQSSINGNTNRLSDRSLVGYKVWRLNLGQEQNETAWTSLTPSIISNLSLIDVGWLTLPVGTYKWAVKAIYTNDVSSLASLSNPLERDPLPTGTMAGVVRNNLNQPITGAVITVGSITALSAANGSYLMHIPAGTHSANCNATGYIAETQDGIVINVGQTTPVNFIMDSVDNEDDLEVIATALNDCYPNPFKHKSTILFDIKEPSQVTIEIFNHKGQFVRSLVNEAKAPGHHKVVWDGTDEAKNKAGSGVYYYKMTVGRYSSTRKMILMK